MVAWLRRAPEVAHPSLVAASQVDSSGIESNLGLTLGDRVLFSRRATVSSWAMLPTQMERRFTTAGVTYSDPAYWEGDDTAPYLTAAVSPLDHEGYYRLSVTAAASPDASAWLDLFDIPRFRIRFGIVRPEYSLPGMTNVHERLGGWHWDPWQAPPYVPGYSWITVLAADAVEQLGGYETLSGRPEFSMTRPLPGGSAGLAATLSMAEYDDASDQAVRSVLLPLLPDGA